MLSLLGVRRATRQTNLVLYPDDIRYPLCVVGDRHASPFLKGVGGVKFVIVAIYYFIKWVEVEPLTSVTKVQC